MCNGSVAQTGVPRIVDNRGRKVLPVGIESFEDVVERCVYIDKTLLVRDLIDRGGTTRFCRPRRFGKSLAMRMLQCFFEAPVEGRIPDRRRLFENLAVWEAGEEYRAEQGSHPVVYLTLGRVRGATWPEARGILADLVATEYQRHAYLFEDGALSVLERPKFERLATGAATSDELSGSLAWLSTLLARHHGAKTVVLIDEYDRPVTEGYLGGFRDQAAGFMRSWLTDALKGTTDLFLACVTGVQRVSRESIFSDLNNLTVDTPLDRAHAESFGFTEAEAEALATYLGKGEKVPEMRAWYDGYCFGGVPMYNPISALCYLRDGWAQPYWANTGGTEVVARTFRRADASLDARLRLLAEGGQVEEPLDMQAVFGEIESSAAPVWSQLYLAGYLTTDDVQNPGDPGLARRLRVPNLEVRRLFGREFLDRARTLATGDRLGELHGALVGGDAERFGRVLGRIVEESASFRDLALEGPCHMLLMGMLYGVPGYRFPVSNRESGLGYSDILLEPLPANEGRLPVVAIEVKRARTAAGGDVDDSQALADHARGVALAQAVEKRYGVGLRGAGRLLWGVSFSGKRVAVALTRPED
jgi:hypothetical protein